MASYSHNDLWLLASALGRHLTRLDRAIRSEYFKKMLEVGHC